MSTLSKVFVIVLLILSAGYAAVNSALFALRQNWKEKHQQLETKSKAEIAKLQHDVAVRDSRITDLDTRGKSLESEVNGLKQSVDSLTAERARLTNQMAEQKLAMEGLRTDMTKISNEIEAQRKENREYAAKIKTLEAELDKNRQTMRDQVLAIEGLQDDKKVLTEEVGNLKKNLATVLTERDELSKLIADLARRGVDVSAGPVAAIDGKVLKFDPQLKIVVISVGKDRGVRIGHQFTAYRGSEYVGRILVEDVQPSIASGRPIDEFMNPKTTLQVGDDVSTRLLR